MARILEAFLLEHIPQFLMSPRVFEAQDVSPVMYSTEPPPQPSWTLAKKGPDGKKMPQIIGHRGFKARYPENTLLAFKAAIDAGAQALETDVHITKDGQVVLSHDPTLKRCFGKDETIISCDWKYLSSLRTLRTPHEPMPRLRDLLEYLATPGLEEVWLLLDIKLDNDPETIIRLIAQTIASVTPSPNKPWSQRVVLGCWALKYLPLCRTYLPSFPITHIGFSTTYARLFLPTPNVSFNLFARILLVPLFGRSFIHDAHKCSRAVYAWTVNDDRLMRWCIREGVDGVITDDPMRFKEVKEEWTAGKREVDVKYKTYLFGVFVWFMSHFMRFIFRWRRSLQRKNIRDPVQLEQTTVGG